MAKHLDKFTSPFQESRIPFLLAEPLTNGQGEMVDLICRFANPAAGELLGITPAALKNARLLRRFPTLSLDPLRPLQQVAFSGSCASFSYTTLLGKPLRITCYQPMYGMAACFLDAVREGGEAAPLPADQIPAAAAMLELSRSGVRCLSCNEQLCALTGWSHRELLDRFGRDLSGLVDPRDWTELLQSLLDAARDNQPLSHEFRLISQAKTPLWVDLRVQPLHTREGVTVFYAVVLDIDRQRRAEGQLEQALSRLRSTQAQISNLFDNLPVGCCLLRRSGNGALATLRVSRELARMLDTDPETLLHQMRTSPLALLPVQEREELSAAAARAAALGQPLRHVCRIVRLDGSPLWISLLALETAEHGGPHMIYAVCLDISAHKNLESEAEFRRQVCDLMMEGGPALVLDYDPDSDIARIDYRSASGHRTLRSVGGYLTQSACMHSGRIHPEDQRRLAAAVRRAVERPAAEAVEYRGDYDGNGWRWYSVTWLRQIDSAGNVTRLLGRAQDITVRKAAAARFQQFKADQKNLAPDMLALARLDLTDDRILDAKGAGRRLKRVLFGNSADACLRHLRDNLPVPGERAAFDALFRRDALLTAFGQGTAHLRLEHGFLLQPDQPVRAETQVRLLEDPDTGNLTAFCAVRRLPEDPVPSALIRLLARDCTLVLTVTVPSGLCRSWSQTVTLPPNTPYPALTAACFRPMPPSPLRASLRQALKLESILAHLEEQPVFSLDAPAAMPAPLAGRRLEWQWLDQDAGVLVLLVRPGPSA